MRDSIPLGECFPALAATLATAVGFVKLGRVRVIESKFTNGQ